MQAKIYNNLTHFSMYYDDIEVNTYNPLYSQIELDLSKMQDGEYTLTLLNNANEIIQKELLRIGDFEIKNYKQEKKFTQYVRK